MMKKRKLHYLSPRDRAWSSFRGILLYIICIFWAGTAIIPMVWVFINSFKDSNEILMNSIALPREWTLKNYVTMANYPGTNLVRSFFNSIVISIGTVVGVVFCAGHAAYAISRVSNRVT